MAEQITISILVKAPIARVWESYSSPEDIVNWNFADPSWHCPSAEVDFRVGGKLLSRMEAKDGSFGFDFGATYDEIVPEKKLAMTIGDGRKYSTVFKEADGGTLVTTIFEAESQNPADMQRSGWQAILDSFARYTESTV